MGYCPAWRPRLLSGVVRPTLRFHEVPIMWKCTKCRESIADAFGVCWNCGTSKDGEEDPSFQREPDCGIATNAPAVELRQSTALPVADAAGHAIQPVEGRAHIPNAVDGRCPHCGRAGLVRAVKLSQPAEAGSVGLQYRAL